jgi:hypothetical protein
MIHIKINTSVAPIAKLITYPSPSALDLQLQDEMSDE